MKEFALVAILSLAGSAVAAPVGTAYVAATWGGGGAAHFLDSGMNSLGSFASGFSDPNGAAFNGANGEILIGGFSPPQVNRFDSNPAGSTTEGLAYRPLNNALYTLEDDFIRAIDPSNGAPLFAIPNPAANEEFAGTAIDWDAGLDLLVVAGDSGNWWKIDPLTGTVSSLGNDGLPIYGLASVPAPAAAGLLALGATLTARRRRR